MCTCVSCVSSCPVGEVIPLVDAEGRQLCAACLAWFDPADLQRAYWKKRKVDVCPACAGDLRVLNAIVKL